MSVLQAFVAGVIQGITEFLPISSSGHLVIYNILINKGEEASILGFTVLLHLATLLAVIVLLRKDLLQLILEFIDLVRDLLRGRWRFSLAKRRFLMLAIIATIPAMVAGVLVKLLKLDAYLENPFLVALMFLVTAVFMLSLDRMPRGRFMQSDAPLTSAWIVGALQAVAILPGLSRSGSTIFGGVLGRLEKEFAVRFAFILSIPVVLGATLLEALDLLKGDSASLAIMEINQLYALGAGFIAAFVTGLASIMLAQFMIKKNKYSYFGYYCIVAAAVALYAGII